MKRIILASASPRRRELMEQAGFTFEICVSTSEEEKGDWRPEETVMRLSEQKALEVAEQFREDCIVIGADTVVACDHEILGKPRDAEDAYRMIHMLQGRVHQVYTGVTIVTGTEHDRVVSTFAEKTDVELYPMTDAMIHAYIDAVGEDRSGEHGQMLGDWRDKAGGYGIQEGFGARYIKGIHGDYYNVVGLPVSRICYELGEMDLL